ncbi:MAG TPA: hypothetical protein VK157_06520, partial [Phycisphaerales bacterium]|nr:hypothetical protein [Phycisphaerales bacterium]
MGRRVAFIAEGVLQLVGDGPPVVVSSEYVRQFLERTEREREQNTWKQQSMGWNLGAGSMMPMSGVTPEVGVRMVRFTAVSAGTTGTLLYSLQTDLAGGLFSLDVAKDEERRIFHRMETRTSDVTQHPSTGKIAMSLQRPDGTAHIGVTGPTGGGLRQVTEGDAFDGAPAWVMSKQAGEQVSEHGVIVYHSAGCSRDAMGMCTHYGPSAIMRLDLDRDVHETLAEHAQFDYLSPRVMRDGSLLCIRRPYKPFADPPGVFSQIKNFVLMPFHIIEGIATFFRTYSDMMQGRPMRSAGGPARRGPNETQLWMWGRAVELERERSKQDGQIA